MSSKYKGISQQPLVGSYSNGRQPPSDLKLCKVEYFINQWSVLTQIWNWSRVYKGMNWRQPLIEWISKYEKKNIWATTGRILFKLENKAMGIKTECTKVSNEDNLKWNTTSERKQPQNMKSGIFQQPLVRSYLNLKLQMEYNFQKKTTSKYEKWNISSTNGQILLKFETWATSVQRYQIKKIEHCNKKLLGSKVSNEDSIQWKTTSNNRWPPNIKSGQRF